MKSQVNTFEREFSSITILFKLVNPVIVNSANPISLQVLAEMVSLEMMKGMDENSSMDSIR